ncbi:MAG TPA: hypothetical protein VFK88_13030 [Gallionella sp.]|nr:hypothetical protein [Gallionella sp.]
MLIRWFLVPSLLAWTQLAGAEQHIHVVLGDQPNRSVKLLRNSATELMMDITGDAETIEKYRQRGINVPLRLSTYRSKVFTTTTGKSGADGSFSFTRTFVDSSSYSEDEKGNRIKLADSAGELVGLEVSGTFDAKGRMSLTSMNGKELSADKEQLIRAVFSSAASAFSPQSTGPLKIGDSFTQSTPFAVPIIGQQPIQVSSSITYTLKKVLGNIAHFDIDTTFSMVNPDPVVQLDATSSGDGTMEYNLDTKLEQNLTLEFNIGVKLQAGEVVISSRAKNSSITRQQIIGDDEEL